MTVDSLFSIDGCAFTITACSENLMSFPILSKCISKRERREKTLFNPNCPQNEASHRILVLSSVEFARWCRLDFKASAGINASIGSSAITERRGLVWCRNRCWDTVFPPGEHDSLIKYSYRQHHKDS